MMRPVIDNRARSFVTIMIIIAISALILRFGIVKIIKINIEQNESNAQTTLKTISTAFETYAAANNGHYPTDVVLQLIRATPPYLKEDYFTKCTISSSCSGYVYNAGTRAVTGYAITARPTNCTMSGTKSFTVSTGGVLTTDAICMPAAGGS